ncbi:Alpha-2-macroglobulin family protein [Parelusimicrobium proximum]|uniref:alpha-2-macroglobulin family protein n=1 Tax=Parelusimicrobium proximum TaxID=3228953 RepID=UPI003D16A7C7
MKKISLFVFSLFILASSLLAQTSSVDIAIKDIQEDLSNKQYESAYKKLRKNSNPKDPIEAAKLNLFKMDFYLEILKSYDYKEDWIANEEENNDLFVPIKENALKEEIEETTIKADLTNSQKPPFLFIDKNKAETEFEIAFNNIWKNKESLRNVPVSKVRFVVPSDNDISKKSLPYVLDAAVYVWGMRESLGNYDNLVRINDSSYAPEFTKELSFDKKLYVLDYMLHLATDNEMDYFGVERVLLPLKYDNPLKNNSNLKEIIRQEYKNIAESLLVAKDVDRVNFNRGNRSFSVNKAELIFKYLSLLSKAKSISSKDKVVICKDLVDTYGDIPELYACKSIIYDNFRPYVHMDAMPIIEQKPNTAFNIKVFSNRKTKLQLYKVNLGSGANPYSFTTRNGKYVSGVLSNGKYGELIREWYYEPEEEESASKSEITIEPITDKGFYYLKAETVDYTEEEKEFIKEYILPICEKTEEDNSFLEDYRYRNCLSANRSVLNEQPQKGIYINITDIALIVTSGINMSVQDAYSAYVKDENPEPGIFTIYPLDIATGSLLNEGTLKYELSNPSGNEKRQIKDIDKMPFEVKFPLNTLKDGVSLLPEVEKDGAHALISHPIKFSYRNPFDRYVLSLLKDKPIYKQNDELKIRIKVLEKTLNGLKAPISDDKVKVQLLKGWGNIKDEKELSLNEFGSANATFLLDDMGKYTLRVFYGDSDIYESIEVKPYQISDFYVEIDDYKKVLHLNEEIVLSGSIKDYNGRQVPDSKVSYSIYVRDYDLNAHMYPNRFQLVSSGIAAVNKKAEFKIDFKTVVLPEEWYRKGKEKDYSFNQAGRIMEYKIETRVENDLFGEAKGEKYLLASDRATFFNLNYDKNYYKKGDDIEFVLSAATVNDLSYGIVAKASVSRLENTPEQVSGDTSGDLQKLFSSAKAVAEIYSKKVRFKKEKSFKLNLKNIKSGIYRLKVEAGKDISEHIFIVIDPDNMKDIYLPSITIPEYNNYTSGQEVEILLGSSFISGDIFVELMQGDFKEEFLTLKAEGLYLVKFKKDVNYKSDYSLNWFSVNDYKIYKSSGWFTVAKPKRNFNLDLKLFSKYMPGGFVNGEVSVKEGPLPADGEMLIRVYNTDLDRISSVNMHEKYDVSLSPMRYFGNGYRTSFSYENKEDFNFPESLYFYDYPKRDNISLYLNAVNFARDFYIKKKEDPIFYYSIAGPADSESFGRRKDSDMSDSNYASKKKFSYGGLLKDSVKDSIAFYPDLKTVAGKAYFSFELPNATANWKILADFSDASDNTGYTSSEFGVVKELSFDIISPLFLRKGDRGTLIVPITNNAEKSLLVELLLEQKTKADYQQILKQQYSIKAKSSQVIPYSIIADAEEDLEFRAAIIKDEFQEVITRTIPVKPSEIKIANTIVQSIAPGKNTISTELPEGIEKIYLDLDFNILEPVLNNIKDGYRSDEKNIDGYMDTYIKAVLLEYIYNNNPEIYAKNQKSRKEMGANFNYLKFLGWLSTKAELKEAKENAYSNFIKSIESIYFDNISIEDYPLLLTKAHKITEDKRLLEMKNAIYPILAKKAFYEKFFNEKEKKSSYASLGPDIYQILIKTYPLMFYGEGKLLEKMTYHDYSTKKDLTFTGKEMIFYFQDTASSTNSELLPHTNIFLAYSYLITKDDKMVKEYIDKFSKYIKKDYFLGAILQPNGDKILTTILGQYEKFTPIMLIDIFKNMGSQYYEEENDIIRNVLLRTKLGTMYRDESLAALIVILEQSKVKNFSSGKIDFSVNDEKIKTFSLYDEDKYHFEEIEVPNNANKAKADILNFSKNPLGMAYLSYLDKPENIQNKNSDVFNIKRVYYKRYLDGTSYKLKELSKDDVIYLDDELEMHIITTTPFDIRSMIVEIPRVSSFDYKEEDVGYGRDKDFSAPDKIVLNLNSGFNGERTIKYILKPSIAGNFSSPSISLTLEALPTIMLSTNDNRVFNVQSK